MEFLAESEKIQKFKVFFIVCTVRLVDVEATFVSVLPTSLISFCPMFAQLNFKCTAYG